VVVPPVVVASMMVMVVVVRMFPGRRRRSSWSSSCCCCCCRCCCGGSQAGLLGRGLEAELELLHLLAGMYVLRGHSVQLMREAILDIEQVFDGELGETKPLNHGLVRVRR
jgi:hypothetical protein